MKYNLYDLTNIHKLIIEGKFDLARKFLEEYKLKYDSEHTFCKRYDALLIAYEGDLESAIKCFKSIVEKDHDKYNITDDAYYLMLLLTKVGRYEEAYQYIEYLDYKELLENTKVAFKNARKLINYLKKVLNKDQEVYDINAYQELQSYYYSDNRAINHIYSRHNYIDKKNAYAFYLTLEDFKKIYDLINKSLLVAERTFDVDFNDTYYFKIDQIGINLQDFTYTDYIKVITLPNEPKIMTMFPVSYNKYSNWNIYDFTNSRNNNYTSSKVRTRTSQIDKFNKKYQK